jgi:hypothetical protein
MANAVYPLARRQCLRTGLTFTAADIKAVLVDTGQYSYSASHEFLTDVPSGARVATSGNLTGKTDTGGVADADNVTFAGLTGGGGSADTIEAVVLYIDTGSAATSRLLAYIDTAAGLPITPTGGDHEIRWNASGIFQV